MAIRNLKIKNRSVDLASQKIRKEGNVKFPKFSIFHQSFESVFQE